MSSCQDMFPHVTKAVVKTLGMQRDLCRNPSIGEDWKMLTVVKIRKDWNKFNWFKQGCEVMEFTLSKLVDLEYTPVITTNTLVEDFQSVNLCSGSLSGKIGDDAAKGHLKASMDAADITSKFTLQSEEVEIDDMFKKFENRKINERFLKQLTLKKHQKLTFVKQRVYNSGPLEILSGATKDGSVGGHFLKWFSASLKGSSINAGSFKVPANKIFAFGLKDFNIIDGCLEISQQRYEFAMSVEKTVNRVSWLNEDGEMVEEIMDSTPEYIPITGQCLLQDLGSEEYLLKSLADRRDLMENLVLILEDRDVLSLLEDTLYQSSYREDDQPDSELVSSFMDAVGGHDVTNAAHLLVHALDALPNDLPTLLAKCGPKTLIILNHMMDNLRENGEVQLPDSLPPLLQEEGELSWVVEFLCSTSKLEGVKMKWDCSLVSPEELLEVLYISVKGLSLMQSEEHP